VRIKLLEQGATLTLDQALTILRTAEAATKQSSNLKHGETAAIQGCPAKTHDMTTLEGCRHDNVC
jgi:hypothetical protein